jgi:hypothetical protein
MTPRAGFLWALLILCGLPVGLLAQDSAPALYDVEIIVFRNLDQSRNTPEVSVPAAPVRPVKDPLEPGEQSPQDPSLQAASPTPLTTGQRPSQDESGQGPQPGFIVLAPRSLPPPVDLPADRLAMGDVLRRLQRLDAYEPLAHIGWEQGASGREVAEAYWLSPAIEARTGLSGSIKLYRERFLHLALDLQLAGRGPTLPGELAPAAFSIRESRLLRDELVQYFDHPGFGVIARVSRHEDSSASSAAGPP